MECEVDDERRLAGAAGAVEERGTAGRDEVRVRVADQWLGVGLVDCGELGSGHDPHPCRGDGKVRGELDERVDRHLISCKWPSSAPV